MAMTYVDAQNIATNRRKELIDAINNGEALSQINYKRGRYIASMQNVIRAAQREGISHTRESYVLEAQLKTHGTNIQRAIDNNKKNNYSMIKEMGLGVRKLVNSARLYKYANTPADKQMGETKIVESIGENLKNIVKAPVVVATKILSSSLAATIMLAPISLGMGILHAAWTVMDSSPSPYEDKVMKHSPELKKFMTKLHKSVQKI